MDLKYSISTLLALVAGAATSGCGDALWEVSADSTRDHFTISACISDHHGDFIHMSIRKQGWDNKYTIIRSPAAGQAHRDWSRVHRWFGELHPNTYLEGRIDDGSGDGPYWADTFTFRIPRGKTYLRRDYADEGGGDYAYITEGYSYADGQDRHPAFGPGMSEVQIYAWYTGTAEDDHPAADGRDGVQYVHYESPLASTGWFKVE